MLATHSGLGCTWMFDVKPGLREHEKACQRTGAAIRRDWPADAGGSSPRGAPGRIDQRAATHSGLGCTPDGSRETGLAGARNGSPADRRCYQARLASRCWRQQSTRAPGRIDQRADTHSGLGGARRMFHVKPGVRHHGRRCQRTGAAAWRGWPAGAGVAADVGDRVDWSVGLARCVMAALLKSHMRQAFSVRRDCRILQWLAAASPMGRYDAGGGFAVAGRGWDVPCGDSAKGAADTFEGKAMGAIVLSFDTGGVGRGWWLK